MARPAPGADRSVAVLELLAGHPDERFTLSEVARRCGLNKATAHALLSALTRCGVLLRHPDEKRYSLGPRLVVIGEAARHGYTAADFAGPVLAELAAETGLWARAWRVAGDHIACVAQAGEPDDPPVEAPAQVPLVPPYGAAFMAWNDTPTVEAWLARARASALVPRAIESLAAIRARGFGVTVASPGGLAQGNGSGQSELGGAGTVLAAQRPLVAEVAPDPEPVGDLDDDTEYPMASLAAPVFGAGGEVVLTVSLSSVSGEPLPGAEVSALGHRLVEAADRLTGAVHGRRRPGET
jgi:DNA-binding IclR family transcriptional regulator